MEHEEKYVLWSFLCKTSNLNMSKDSTIYLVHRMFTLCWMLRVTVACLRYVLFVPDAELAACT